jgi:hypothetical protein
LDHFLKVRKASALTEEMLPSQSVKLWFAEWLRYNRPDLYRDVYINNTSHKPAYWKVNLNKTFIDELKNAR